MVNSDDELADSGLSEMVRVNWYENPEGVPKKWLI